MTLPLSARAAALAVFFATLSIAGCRNGAYRPPERGSGPSPANAEPAPRRPAPRASTGGRPDPTIASWRGGGVHASDLGRFMLRTMRPESLAALSRLVSEQLLGREVEKLGIRVPPGFLVVRREQLLRDVEIDAARAYGPDADAATYVRLRHRRSLAAWLRERLVEERQRWLFERVVRYRALGTDRVRIRLFATTDRDLARDVASRLARGEGFEALIRAHSQHGSKEKGGLLPPLPKAALNPVVAARAFALPLRQTSEVLEVEDEAGRRQYEILRVEERLRAVVGTWNELREAVEESLRAEPLQLPEWTAWMIQLEREHGVELKLDAL